jgi:protein SCO1/2
VLIAGTASAQPKDPFGGRDPYAVRDQNRTQNIVKQVGIDQKLNAQIPLGLVFRDETGRQVTLNDYFGSKPVILSLAYFECPMLCTMVLNGIVTAVRPLSFDIGKEFDVITVSINPKDTPELAAKKKQSYMRSYGRPGSEKGWHFLTGDEANIKKLADAVGFRYTYDPATGQFAHAGGIMVVTPQGKLARYFYGVEYPTNDIRLGLVEASHNKIGTPVDQVLLLCFHYDPTSGRYGWAVIGLLKIGGALTLLILGGFVFLMLRRDRRRKLEQELAVSAMSAVNGQSK